MPDETESPILPPENISNENIDVIRSVEEDLELQTKIDDYNDNRRLKDEAITLVVWGIKYGVPLLFFLIVIYAIFLVIIGRYDVVNEWIKNSVIFIIGGLVTPLLSSAFKKK